MQQPTTLTVLPNGSRMFPNLEAMEAGVRRFIGRSYQPIADAKDGKLTGKQYGFVPVSDPVTIPFREEYLTALLDLDLLPGDDATAAYLASRK